MNFLAMKHDSPRSSDGDGIWQRDGHKKSKLAMEEGSMATRAAIGAALIVNVLATLTMVSVSSSTT